MMNGAILTKDNLLKRKWKESPICYFCDMEENIQHLFFGCPIAKIIGAVIAKGIGANNVPKNLDQCSKWCDMWLPLGISCFWDCSNMLGYLEVQE